MRLLLASCSFAASTALALTAPDAPAATPYTLDNTEVRILPRSANGRDYTLFIGLPSSYASSPTRTYPVVYATDGYWDFSLLCWESSVLVVDGQIPECIVVGISYSGANPDYGILRTWDLTPGYDPYAGTNSGHAQEFLGVIAEEFIPFVEQNYRVDSSYRVLAGSSYGGLFTMYALFERPGLFQAYIAVSPSLWYRSSYVAQREREYAQTHSDFNARVYLTYAAGDTAAIRDSTRAFAAQLRRSDYTSFASAVREIEGERHSGTKAEGFHRGLRFAFAPRAPTPWMQPNPGYGSRSPMVALSTRGRVGGGENVLIAGFVIDGPEAKRVLVRAVGPSLVPQGVADALPDPRLTVFDATQRPLASNDNWSEGENPAALIVAAARTGAIPFAANSRDAAVLVTLEPGVYTAVIEGANGAEGVALAEVYEALP